MRNLELVRAEAAGGPADGLEPLDPRLTSILDLGSRDEYEAAADAVEELLGEGIHDIRLSVIYLYQAFVDRGLGGIAEVLSELGRMLEGDWGAFGPSDRKDKHVDKSVAWFFQHAMDLIEYREHKRDEVWSRWLASTAVDDLVRAGSETERILNRLSDDAFDASAERIGRALRWLREQQRTLEAHEKPALADESASPPVDAQGDDKGESDGGSIARAQSSMEARTRPSAKYHELCAKLDAFQELIRRSSHTKAALVGDDVLNLIEHFDPREYFPGLFADFFAELSGHIGRLSPHWEERESIAWKTMEQFYRVDIDGFVGDE